MAEIPVERKEKSAFPMWLLPLLLLLLLIPLFYYMCGRSNTVVVDNTNGNRAVVTSNAGNMMSNAANTAVVVNNNTGNANVSGSTSNPTGEVVTAVNFFGFTKDKMSLVGRKADLRSARVEHVVSDRVFTVKSEGQKMFVMLDDSLNQGQKEEQIKIRAGQNLQLGGEFRAVPTAEVKDEAQNRDLSAKNYAQMKGQQVYLHATSISDAR